MAANALANGLTKLSPSARRRLDWLKLPLLEKNETFAHQFSRFIMTGELEAGMDLRKIDEAIMGWIERIEKKRGKRRDSGVIEGKARDELSGVYSLFSNMVTGNILNWEPSGLSWARSRKAEGVAEDLLSSTSLVSRLDVLQPLQEIENSVRGDVDLAITKAMEKAKEDGTYSDKIEKELMGSLPELANAVAVQTRRALAVMYLTSISPETVKGFEVRGAFIGRRILLANWGENPSWEDRYTPWHEAVHKHAKQGFVKRESPLTYAMNYLPLLIHENAEAFEMARKSRDFRPEDLLIDDMDPGAREAGLALAARMKRFCDGIVGEASKAFGELGGPLSEEGNLGLRIFFLQKYLGHLGSGQAPGQVEKKISHYFRSMVYLLEAQRALELKSLKSNPVIPEAAGAIQNLLKLSQAFPFDEVRRLIEEGGIRAEISPKSLRMLKELMDTCSESSRLAVKGSAPEDISRQSWRFLRICQKSMLCGVNPRKAASQIARIAKLNKLIGEIKRGVLHEITDHLAAAMFTMDYVDKYGQSKPLAETLAYLRERKDLLSDEFDWINPMCSDVGDRARLAGVEEGLSMVEFCCRQAERLGNPAHEDWTFFHDYKTMLFEGYHPSLIEAMIKLEVDCDLKAMRKTDRRKA